MTVTSIAADNALRIGVRMLARATLLLGHLALALVLSWWLTRRFGPRWHQSRPGRQTKMWWTRRLADVLGLRVHVHGRSLEGPVLLAANHVSWLDIVAIAAVSPACFLSKSEVRTWPLVGRLAQRCGTLFLERDRVRVLQGAVQAIGRELDLGNAVVVFPEGTSTTGDDIEPFRPALFQAAAVSRSRVQPLALRYVRDGARDSIAPFVGDDDLVRHLLRLTKAKATNVHLYFLPPLDHEDGSRAQLAAAAHARVRSVIEAPCGEPGRVDTVASPQPVYSSTPTS